jgi:23S rRNA (cytosine1962-C5)-methyltransferase
MAEVTAALSAYARLTALGLSVLEPDGFLMISSCSSHVTAQAFFAAVHAGARKAGRALTEQRISGHPIDHPVGFREGEYLKALIGCVRSPRRVR